MKTILKIILIFTALISISCDNLFNDLAVEIGEYNYYLAVGAGSNIRIYSIDSDGTPDSVYNQSIGVGATIYNISVHPTGKYLYVPDSGNDIFYVYKVNNDGSLTNIDSISTGASTNPYGVKVDPTGKYLYVSYSTASTSKINVFKINSDGKLTDLGSANAPGSSSPQLIVLHPSGKSLYVTLNTGGGFAQFKVNNDASLSSPILTSIADSPYDIAVHPNGRYIYVTSISNNPNNLHKYDLNSDGTVNSSSQISYLVGSSARNSITIHPDGSYIYIKEGSSSNIYAYKINADGSLTYSGQTPDLIPSGNSRITIHPYGKYVYLTEFGGNRLSYNITLKPDGLFDQDYSHIEIANGATSNPVIIRRKKL